MYIFGMVVEDKQEKAMDRGCPLPLSCSPYFVIKHTPIKANSSFNYIFILFLNYYNQNLFLGGDAFWCFFPFFLSLPNIPIIQNHSILSLRK